MSDDYPGIEIRVYPPGWTGEPYVIGNSRDLHYDLSAGWLNSGCPADTWHTVMSGELVIEIRAVCLEAPPPAPDYPADLFRGVPGALGQLAELERAAAGRVAERAAAEERCCICGRARVDYRNYRDDPFCWPCADGRPIDPAAPCGICGHTGGWHAEGERWNAEHAAAAAPPGGMADTAAAVAIGPVLTESTGTELSWPALAGARIARIARRARSLLGRS